MEREIEALFFQAVGLTMVRYNCTAEEAVEFVFKDLEEQLRCAKDGISPRRVAYESQRDTPGADTLP